MNSILGTADYYLILANSSNLSREQLTAILVAQPQIGYLVVDKSELNEVIEASAKSNGWELLAVDAKWQYKMRRYLNETGFTPSEYQAKLMAIFVSSDIQAPWPVERMSFENTEVMIVSFHKKKKQPKPTKKLILCHQQPCSCSTSHEQHSERIIKLAKQNHVQVIKSNCLGYCSAMASALCVEAGKAGVYTTDIYLKSNEQLQQYFQGAH
ncbi:hypothetical protein [Shewanella sp. KT0246]|uniref:hypothetical protein n=1 Tax=Shewanella sp. KT0246 TaxID=2815912 RepID=UPI001BBAC506|nr:hypothetical protein [Shewanella sp. KT0246]GIU48429.1 hypothetical protein TUM4249_03700 [Shewanella sp. KT0246]